MILTVTHTWHNKETWRAINYSGVAQFLVWQNRKKEMNECAPHVGCAFTPLGVLCTQKPNLCRTLLHRTLLYRVLQSSAEFGFCCMSVVVARVPAVSSVLAQAAVCMSVSRNRTCFRVGFIVSCMLYFGVCVAVLYCLIFFCVYYSSSVSQSASQSFGQFSQPKESVVVVIGN